jgi:phospholipid/cholesterol/gamma-HCH transport system substrate-binding protein
MNKTTRIEIMVGVFMAAALAALFFLAMKVSNLGTFTAGDVYQVTARFQNVGGLKVKAPVTMAGVEIGRVRAIGYDPKSFEAVVTLGIDNRYDAIPDDTFAKILTAGLLGEQYIGLEPGGSLRNLSEGDEVRLTQPALVLEDIIGQFIFGKAQEGELK